MPECTSDHPPMLRLRDGFGERDVSCWLQDSAHAVPAELALTHDAASARVTPASATEADPA
jgi:hypothetical protein